MMQIRKTVIVPLVPWTFVATLLAWYWFAALRPAAQHRRLCTEIKQCIDSLRHKRPKEVNRKEWAYVLAWTENVQANCLGRDQITDYEHFRRFVDELKRRVDEDVDLHTVDWIWDEIVAFSSVGPWYAEHWRPTSRERLKEAATSDYGIAAD